MKKTIGVLICLALGLGSVQSQNRLAKRGLPFLTERDSRTLDAQAEQFFEAVEPLVARVNEHAVQVESRGRQLGLGTVIPGGIVTKWSEVKRWRNAMTVLGHDGVRRGVRVKAVYKDYDLAVLDYQGELPPVEFTDLKEPEVGSFLVLAGPGKGARGLGVVSVGVRSLREEDKAFLGVRMGIAKVQGGGVRLRSVEEDSAADRAGLRAGDIVKRIDDRVVNGLLEMGNVLQRMKPGEVVNLSLKRGEREFTSKVTLGARPKFERIKPERMNRMRSMGGRINAIGEGFPDVIQSDMQIDKSESGGPVFDLDGNFVGVVVARSSRIKTYIIPAEKLAEVLDGKADFTAAGREPGSR